MLERGYLCRGGDDIHLLAEAGGLLLVILDVQLLPAAQCLLLGEPFGD
jgi:hypothetical protein